jgi:hypothetical protein
MCASAPTPPAVWRHYYFENDAYLGNVGSLEDEMKDDDIDQSRTSDELSIAHTDLTIALKLISELRGFQLLLDGRIAAVEAMRTVLDETEMRVESALAIARRISRDFAKPSLRLPHGMR